MGNVPLSVPVAHLAAATSTIRCTMEGLSAEAFPQELAGLIELFSAEGLRQPLTATPGQGDMPAIWLLGSSGYSAQLAGLLGLPFAFAHHFSSANTVPALALYRRHFQAVRLAGTPARDGGGECDLRADRRAAPRNPSASSCPACSSGLRPTS